MSPREARKKRGLSLRKACDLMGGHDIGRMSLLERGQGIPSPESALAIVTLYDGDVTWEELFHPHLRAEWIARLELEADEDTRQAPETA